MDYAKFDINDKINFKGTLEAFAKYAVEDWKKAQTKAVYRGKVPKSGRTSYLKNNWTHSIIDLATGSATLRFSYPMYGLFVDIGVGKGSNYTAQQYSRSRYGRKMGDGEARRPKRWKNKTKAFTQKRIGEVLTKRYGKNFVQFAKNKLTLVSTFEM
jgi:hypothetical protein